MESKVIIEKKNPFLSREEITLEIKNDVAPSFEDVKTQIGKDSDLTVVKKINTNFGRHTFIAEAVVYENTEAKEKIETIPKKIRKKMEADKKAAEEAAKKEAEAAAKAVEEAKAAKAAEAENPTEEPATEEASAEEKPEEKIE